MTVATFGETDDFPAFYTPKSGFKSPWSVATAADAAKMIRPSRLPSRSLFQPFLSAELLD